MIIEENVLRFHNQGAWLIDYETNERRTRDDEDLRSILSRAQKHRYPYAIWGYFLGDGYNNPQLLYVPDGEVHPTPEALAMRLVMSGKWEARYGTIQPVSPVITPLEVEP